MRSLFLALSLLGTLFLTPVQAETNNLSLNPREEILKLRDVVEEKKQLLTELQAQIEEAKKKIQKEQAKVISYTNQIALIENRLAKTALDIKAKNLEIEKIQLEIEVLVQEIKEKESELARGRATLAELLREIKKTSDRSSLQVILSYQRFSEFYANLKFLEDVQTALQKTLKEIDSIKNQRESEQKEQEMKLAGLAKLKGELEEKQEKLKDEQGAKLYLLAAAEESEAKFQTLWRRLREESQLIDIELGTLEERITERLRTLDLELEPGALLSWPLEGGRTVVAGFHDPDYPFRYLFEHSGIDLRAAVGSAVGAAAPGIVAVAKTGRLYGNYVIILHGNKIATLYAHLSRILVRSDQVVKRGETIGLSGGRPGSPGAGLSSGPHLHFEVRVNGIPTNPLGYLLNF